MKLDETSWGETSIHGYLWKTEEDDEPSDVGTMLGQLFEDKQSSLEIDLVFLQQSCSYHRTVAPRFARTNSAECPL